MMRIRLGRILLYAFAFAFVLATVGFAWAQSPSASPDLKVVTRTTPIYPPIAKAAHVSGDVKLQLQIGSDGYVLSSKVVSGPPMLIGAAQDCVKHWIYEPLLRGGKPVPASTIATISFALPGSVNPNDEKIAAEFFPLDQACIKAVVSNVDASQQASTCRKAAEVAEKFSPEERFIERRSAYVYASAALRRNKQLEESLGYANKAVAVVEQGHDDGSGSSAAYSTRAQVYAQLGELEKASDDLNKAERFERDAIAEMLPLNEQFTKHQYVPTLKSLLNFHAQILAALGNQQEAEAKVADANRL